MRLATVILLLAVACASAARHGTKNRRIIRIRVPQRQYLDAYGGHKGHPRPSGFPPGRYRDHHTKHHEFIRPNHPPQFSNFGGIYTKHQSRPPPSFVLFPGLNGGPSVNGFEKDVPQKISVSYGSGLPQKGSVSGFKFPSVKDEIRITHTKAISSGIPLSSSSSSSSPAAPPSPSFTLHQPTSYHVASHHAHHAHVSGDDHGPIREIPAPNLALKPDDGTYGKGPSLDVTQLVGEDGGQLSVPASEYYSAFGQGQNFEFVSDGKASAISVQGPGFYKDNQGTSSDGSSGFGGAVKADAGASYVSDSSYKSNHVVVTPLPQVSNGYEVTENQQQGTGPEIANPQFYYAPDPDPSMPVHKVPPTKDPFAEEKKLAETYISQVPQNFQILEGGSVAAPVTTLSAQELFHLMNGYSRPIIQQTIVPEPVVTILGHPQQAAMLLQSNYGFAQQGGPHYGDVSDGQYLQQVGVHSGLQQGEASQQVLIQQSGYLPVRQQAYDQSYQNQVAHVGSYQSDGEAGKQHYEPEASESEKHGSLSEVDDDSSKRGNSVDGSDISSQPEDRVIIRFNRLPEVPFYSTLPNREAAEALTTLQAAGSIGSTYAKKTEANADGSENVRDEATAGGTQRGDQGPETEGDGELPFDISAFRLPQNILVAPVKVEPETEAPPRSSTSAVDIQKSISIFETSYSALDPDDSSDSDISESSTSESRGDSFGQRIRPK